MSQLSVEVQQSHDVVLPERPDIGQFVPKLGSPKSERSLTPVPVSTSPRGIIDVDTALALTEKPHTDLEPALRERRRMLVSKSYDTAFTKLLNRRADLAVENDPGRYQAIYGDDFAQVTEDIKRLEVAKAEGRDAALDEKGKWWIWLTVNPVYEGFSFQEQLSRLEPHMDRLFRYIWVVSFYMCLEQRSSDPADFQGLHMHALIKRNKPPSECERDIRKLFAPITGNPKHIHIVHCNDALFGQKLSYMRGNKTADQLEKPMVDQAMREYYELEDLYTEENYFEEKEDEPDEDEDEDEDEDDEEDEEEEDD